jgi:hypothetical protein
MALPDPIIEFLRINDLHRITEGLTMLDLRVHRTTKWLRSLGVLYYAEHGSRPVNLPTTQTINSGMMVTLSLPSGSPSGTWNPYALFTGSGLDTLQRWVTTGFLPKELKHKRV